MNVCVYVFMYVQLNACIHIMYVRKALYIYLCLYRYCCIFNCRFNIHYRLCLFIILHKNVLVVEINIYFSCTEIVKISYCSSPQALI